VPWHSQATCQAATWTAWLVSIAYSHPWLHDPAVWQAGKRRYWAAVLRKVAGMASMRMVLMQAVFSNEACLGVCMCVAVLVCVCVCLRETNT
jgi:hypothetical protein